MFQIALIAMCTFSSQVAQQMQSVSPFSEVRHPGDGEVLVKYRRRMFKLVSIEEASTAEMLAFCRKTYGNRWQKRFDEDLLQVLIAMGKNVKKVKLELIDVKTRRSITIPSAEMTKENRSSVMRERKKRFCPEDMAKAGRSTNQMIDAFYAALKQRWSYYKAGGEMELALERLIEQAGDDKDKSGISADQLVAEFSRIIAMGIDGHASISGQKFKPGRLPFLIEPIGDRYVAFLPDRSRFLDPQHPFITHLDGRPIQEWCKTTLPFVAKGSPQYIKWQSLRLVRSLNHWRTELKIPLDANVKVQLTSANRASQKSILEKVDSRAPVYGKWPLSLSKILQGNIGYLRLQTMSDGSLEEVQKWMPKFRDTNGLIVDVRDNTGGGRQALLALAGYLLGKDDKPRAVNAAKYRKFDEFGSGHLESRFMYREDSQRWSDADRAAITKFRSRFKPEWEPPKDDFSDWHYLVLKRGTDAETFHYNRPVVVLMNAKCFSATDIFLAGMKELPNVTLLGTASGGGSARVTVVRIGEYLLRIGSMASFQVDGKLFDTNGVQPDVEIDPEPTYFIGKSDKTLDAAIRLIKGE